MNIVRTELAVVQTGYSLDRTSKSSAIVQLWTWNPEGKGVLRVLPQLWSKAHPEKDQI